MGAMFAPIPVGADWRTRSAKATCHSPFRSSTWIDKTRRLDRWVLSNSRAEPKAWERTAFIWTPNWAGCFVSGQVRCFWRCQHGRRWLSDSLVAERGQRRSAEPPVSCLLHEAVRTKRPSVSLTPRARQWPLALAGLSANCQTEAVGRMTRRRRGKRPPQKSFPKPRYFRCHQTRLVMHMSMAIDMRQFHRHPSVRSYCVSGANRFLSRWRRLCWPVWLSWEVS